MTQSNLMKEAHQWAKEIKKEYPEVDYHTQVGLCYSTLLRENGNTLDKE